MTTSILLMMKSNPQSLLFLDGLRGLAAIYVVIGHARWLLWEGFAGFQSHVSQYTWWNEILAYALVIFRYGHEAVLFFFVLSGFVIHLKYARQWQKDASTPFDWFHYLKRRAWRIYPPLFLVFGLSYCLVIVGQNAGFSIYSSNSPYPLINENIKAVIDLKTLLGNLAFLMDTYVPVFGTNGPLWSLKYEWWFYMVYPIIVSFNKRSIFPATAMVILLFIASFFPAYWPLLLLNQIAGLLLSWWLGVILAEVFVGRVQYPWSKLLLLSPILGLGLLDLGKNPVLNDTYCALGFAGVLSFCFWLQSRGMSLIVLEKLKWLGDCSYTLYVVHFPLMVLISGFLIQKNGLLPTHFGFVVAVIFLVVLLAWLLHFVIEKPFASRK
jgi:peptidoglycan/LPS O-acetylase OafA/YrhL